MFDIGWTELLVIAVVLIVVVGPKDLPPMLRAFGKTMTRFRKVAGEFRAQFDEALREADLDEVRQHIADAQKLNPANSLREAMNPLRQMGNDIKADLQRSTTIERPQTVETQMLPSSPVEPPAPAPVIAPPPEVVAEAAPVKPKVVRKPRAKVAEAAVLEPAQIAVAEASEKPKRAPRKAVAETVAADVAAVEPVTPKKPATRSKVSAEKAAAALLVEPTQVGISEAETKPKRAPRKSAAAADAVEPALEAPKKSRRTATKKDDA